MQMQDQRFSEGVVFRLDPEDPAALRLQKAAADKVIDASSRNKARVQLDERRGPETPAPVGILDGCPDVVRTDFREAPGKFLVVVDDAVAERKNVHSGASLKKLNG